MEKSLEQFKYIERISRETRRHRAYLNQIYDQNLRVQLDQLDKQRQLTILRSASHQRIEQERKQVVKLTIEQIAKRRQEQQSSRINKTPFEEETIKDLSQTHQSRPSSAIRLPSTGTPCSLFSSHCQFYPCQPVCQYTSISTRTHDKKLQQRHSPTGNTMKSSNAAAHLKEFLTRIGERKQQNKSRQYQLAMQSQSHLIHQHVSMQRTMTKLEEQSRVLHERLSEKKTFGYDKERQHKLSQAIQSHLRISAKFCA